MKQAHLELRVEFGISSVKGEGNAVTKRAWEESMMRRGT
jgi:hypothetical protein